MIYFFTNVSQLHIFYKNIIIFHPQHYKNKNTPSMKFSLMRSIFTISTI